MKIQKLNLLKHFLLFIVLIISLSLLLTGLTENLFFYYVVGALAGLITSCIGNKIWPLFRF